MFNGTLIKRSATGGTAALILLFFLSNMSSPSRSSNIASSPNKEPESSPYNEPPESSPYNEPPESSPFNEPPESSPYNETPESSPYNEPGSSPYNEPQSSPYKSPVSSPPCEDPGSPCSRDALADDWSPERKRYKYDDQAKDPSNHLYEIPGDTASTDTSTQETLKTSGLEVMELMGPSTTPTTCDASIPGTNASHPDYLFGLDQGFGGCIPTTASGDEAAPAAVIDVNDSNSDLSTAVLDHVGLGVVFQDANNGTSDACQGGGPSVSGSDISSLSDMTSSDSACSDSASSDTSSSDSLSSSSSSSSSSSTPSSDSESGDSESSSDSMTLLPKKVFEGGKLSVDEGVLCVMNLFMKKKIEKSLVGDILKVILQFLPKYHHMPKSQHLLFKFVRDLCPLPPPKMHYYCKKCQFYVGEQNVQCSLCKSDCDKFLQLSLAAQIKNLFQLNNLADVMDNFYSQHSFIEGAYSDICDGSVFKRAWCGGKYDLVLHGYTDGVSLSESSNVQLWPLEFTICQLPFKVRFRYVLICGIWVDSSKPLLNTYLVPFVKELQELHENGVKWMHPQSKLEFTSRVSAPGFCGDAPVRGEAQQVQQHGGRHCCNMCEEKMVACTCAETGEKKGSFVSRRKEAVCARQKGWTNRVEKLGK